MPKMDGLELHRRIEEETDVDVPFILLTGKEDEDVAIKALNQGIDRYSKKGNKDVRQVSGNSSSVEGSFFKSLAMEVVQEIEMDRRGSEWVEIYSDTIPLLEKMLDGGIEEIRPSINLDEVPPISYPEAESEIGVPADEAIEILESLVEEKVLSEEFSEKIFVCPRCNTAHLRFRTRCPYCGSQALSKKEALEHLSCGNIALREEFRFEGDELICPKCNKELESIGVDYTRAGIRYLCEDCEEKFDRPE
ncbi:MAG: response regulator [Candidatus Hadarchaeota archaeon]